MLHHFRAAFGCIALGRKLRLDWPGKGNHSHETIQAVKSMRNRSTHENKTEGTPDNREFGHPQRATTDSSKIRRHKMTYAHFLEEKTI